MLGATLIGGAIVSKAQGVFADVLWSKISGAARARLTLSKDTLKKAMEVALIYALERTVQKHLYFDSDLFLGNLFERPDTALVERLLSRENYPTARELAEAWAANLAGTPDSERPRYAEAMLPQCETFLHEFRRALTHTRLLQADPVMADLLALDARADASAATAATTQTAQNIARLEQQMAQWGENVTEAYQHLSATLSEWMQRRWTQGIQQLPTNFTTEIQNFLYEYLGGTVHTVPFGGRQADLDFLTQWLDDPYKPQRLLIAAEAGRGKSALLVRWCADLQLRGDVHIIFVPISLRFGTAAPETFFSALAARLAVIRGETIQHSNLNAAQLKGVYNSYVAQLLPHQRVLIVLDGLDESLDAQYIDKSLVPRTLPPGVKVVVSARTQTDKTEAEWLRTLGWDMGNLGRSTTLFPLTERGVKDVLEAMGNPLDGLAERDTVIRQLFRLTEGDPLLVGLYVNALVAKGGQVAYITSEELDQIEPGLEGYFDQWWEDQHKQWEAKGKNPLTKPEVEDFFYTLATARGPISRDELQHILKGCSGPRLAQMALDVKRFIVGDGVRIGYAFNHARLGYYFLDQLSESDRAQNHQKFVDYGEEILTKLTVTKAPFVVKTHPYILQYYVHHLTHTNAPVEKYYALLCHEWAEAWFALRGTYDGFLVDVERVWERAHEDTQNGDRVRGMSKEILCALCQSSIVTLSSNIEPELLAMAVEANIYTPTQAFVMIRQMATDRQKANAVGVLFKLNLFSNAVRREILEFSLTIQNETYRALSIHAIAPHLSLDLLQEALAAARDIQDESARAYTLGAIAPLFEGEMRLVLLQEALTAARIIQKERSRASALHAIALHLPPFLLPEVLAAVRAIRDEPSRFYALRTIAPLFEEEMRFTLLQEALALIRGTKDESYRASFLSSIAPLFGGHERITLLQEALTAVRGIQNEYLRASTLGTIATHLPSSLLHGTIAAAHTIQGKIPRTSALSRIAPLFEGKMRITLLQEALTATRDIQDESSRASALGTIAPLFEGEMQIILLQEALAAARAIHHGPSRASALGTIASLFEGEMRITLLQEALDAVRTIRDDSSRAYALSSIASLFEGKMRITLLREALAATRNIQDKSSHASALGTIAPLFEEEMRITLLQEALAAARDIQNESSQPAALCTIASLFEGEMRVTLLQEALTATRDIQDKSFSAFNLGAIAPHLSPSLLLDAFAAARAIENEEYRTDALNAIAPYLPPSLLPEAVATARAIENEYYRANALGGIAPCLVPALLQEALTAVHDIRDEYCRASALGAIAPYLPPALLQEALVATNTIQQHFYRASILGALTPLFEGQERITLLQEALAAIFDIRDEHFRASTLGAIVPYLPPALLQEALTAVHDIGDEHYRASALCSITPHLPVALLQDTLTVARTFQNEFFRTSTLSIIISTLLSQDTYALRLNPWLNEAQVTIQKFATFPRSAFINDLTALLPLLCALADVDIPVTSRHFLSLTRQELSRLKSAMIQTQYLDWTIVLKRRNFLESAGLSVLEKQLLMELPQQDFVPALLRAVQAAPAEGGVTAMEKLLRQLAVEWAGDEERRTFVEDLLGTPRTQDTPSTRLAGEMFKAIQEVTSWWP